MHVRSDDNQPQPAVESAQRDVGVVELRDGDYHHFVHDDVPNLKSENWNQPQPQDIAPNMLTQVKTSGGGHVHPIVAVVHPVKPPQQRYGVIGSMDVHHYQAIAMNPTPMTNAVRIARELVANKRLY